MITHHLSKYNTTEPEIARMLEDSLYVDDLVAGAGSVEQAYNLYLRAKKIMAEAGMNLESGHHANAKNPTSRG